MTAIRLLVARRRAAILLLAATLLLRLLVPAGYMIGGEGGHLTVELCSGTIAMPQAHAMAAMPGGMPDRRHAGDHGKAEMPCAFSGIALAALGAVDPVQLAALLAFILAAGIAAPPAPAIVRHVHLRPPLRGPPAS